MAINLLGFIFTVQKLSPQALQHELIHSRQQREMLYIPFFLWYVLEWCVLWAKCGDRMKAYRNIRFEREAYTHEQDADYLQKRKPYACFRSTNI